MLHTEPHFPSRLLSCNFQCHSINASCLVRNTNNYPANLVHTLASVFEYKFVGTPSFPIAAPATASQIPKLSTPPHPQAGTLSPEHEGSLVWLHRSAGIGGGGLSLKWGCFCRYLGRQTAPEERCRRQRGKGVGRHALRLPLRLRCRGRVWSSAGWRSAAPRTAAAAGRRAGVSRSLPSHTHSTANVQNEWIGQLSGRQEALLSSWPWRQVL